MENIPKIPVGDWVNELIIFIQINFAGFFEVVRVVIEALVEGLRDGILFMPPVLFIAFAMVLIFLITNRRIALGTGLGLFMLLNLGLWDASMNTLSLVLTATFLALLLGIPFGILTAWSEVAHKCTMPVLDLMQTMPPFVYLVPAVILFKIGVVPALIATVVFAMPPVIRLTGLGIRQVPGDLLEAAEAFGSTKSQKLVKIQLPLALPTIMAGINQCIMLSLSMVVIAAMIGAGGLGGEVLRGLQRLDIPTGFEGGLAIVIIAIILDRVTQNLGKEKKTRAAH